MHLVGLRILPAIVALCATLALCRGDSGTDAQAAFEGKDYATAIRLWEPLVQLTAEGGDPRAPVLLGLIYDIGNGVPRDIVKAYEWLDIARSLSHTKVAIETSKLFLSGVAEDITPEQMASAKQLADQWRAAHRDLVTPN